MTNNIHWPLTGYIQKETLGKNNTINIKQYKHGDNKKYANQEIFANKIQN